MYSRTGPLKLWWDACKSDGEGKVSDNKSQCDRQEVFSDKVHKLVIPKPRVRGSYSKEDDRKQCSFCYQVTCCQFGQGRYVVGAEEEDGRECIH